MDDFHVPDLDAYFERIGYTGPRRADLATLHAITAHHAASIPFENVDVFAGREVLTTPEAIENKIVRRWRGGYCFETNQLLIWVLRAIGFKVRPLSARVRWNAPREFIPPRTHVFLQVTLGDREWLTDCGIGGVSLTSAIPFVDGEVYRTPHDERRVIRESGKWFHQVRFDTEWLDASEFTGEEMPLIDRAIANWWTSTSPESKFRKNLILANAGADGSRRSLINREFTLRIPCQPPRKAMISSAEHLGEILEREFLLSSGAVEVEGLYERIRTL